MSNLFKKVTLTHAIIFTILFAASFTVINYSGIGVAGLLNITGGASVLDFERGYSIVKAQNMLASLGTEGQEFYLAKLIPLDFIFPFTYMIFYSGWIVLLLRRLDVKNRFGALLLLPVSAMLFDWIENIGIIVMLTSYPAIPAWGVRLGSISGILKWIAIRCNILLIGVLLIVFLVRHFKKRQ